VTRYPRFIWWPSAWGCSTRCSSAGQAAQATRSPPSPWWAALVSGMLSLTPGVRAMGEPLTTGLGMAQGRRVERRRGRLIRREVSELPSMGLKERNALPLGNVSVTRWRWPATCQPGKNFREHLRQRKMYRQEALAGLKIRPRLCQRGNWAAGSSLRRTPEVGNLPARSRHREKGTNVPGAAQPTRAATAWSGEKIQLQR